VTKQFDICNIRRNTIVPFQKKMFKDIFVQGSQAMISTLSWSGSTVSGYPEPESTFEMYEVPDGSWKSSEIGASGNDEKTTSEDVLSGRLSFVHQVGSLDRFAYLTIFLI